jgi:hypothetical protein
MTRGLGLFNHTVTTLLSNTLSAPKKALSNTVAFVPKAIADAKATAEAIQQAATLGLNAELNSQRFFTTKTNELRQKPIPAAVPFSPRMFSTRPTPAPRANTLSKKQAQHVLSIVPTVNLDNTFKPKF